jgi:wyosine [tRNA(Phe)-imidazoG37] synthetase (radical SAM superfamily)
MLTNIISRYQDIVKLRNGEIVLPSFVDIHACDLCNQNCIGCAYHDLHTQNMMTEKQHLFTLRTFLDMDVKAFDFAGGGEPTLLPYLGEHMDFIAKNNATFGLLTNGTRLREIGKHLLNGGYVRVSLEASNPKQYGSYKNADPLAWIDVLTQIRGLVKLRNDANSNLEITVKFAVGKHLRGCDHYRDGILLARDLGVDRIVFKALRHQPEELEPITKEIEANRLREMVHDLRAEDMVRSWINPIPFDKVPQCWLNPLHTVIDWRGDMYICCFYYFREERHKIGNIFETPFHELWFSELHRQKIREIKREECFKVDCKVVLHHHAVQDFEKGMRGHFL